MNKGIAVAGNLIVDYVKSIDKYPKAGLLANVRSISRCIGGCAGNTSCDLAMIDGTLPLICIGRVGNDENGTYIVDLLQSKGINTNGITVSDGKPTSITDVMFDLDSSERTFFHSRGANAELSLNHLDINEITASILHMGYVLLLDELDKANNRYGTVMAKALAMAQKKGIKTSIDVVSEEGDRYKTVVTPCLAYCDYFIVNEIEAGNVAGLDVRDNKGNLSIQNLRLVCEKLLSYGVRELVAIHMPELGCAMNAGGTFCTAASYELAKGYIKGTVGAGDAFCAGMLYALYHDWDMDRALRFANASAACCLGHENSIDGMRPLREIEEFQSTLNTKKGII